MTHHPLKCLSLTITSCSGRLPPLLQDLLAARHEVETEVVAFQRSVRESVNFEIYPKQYRLVPYMEGLGIMIYTSVTADWPTLFQPSLLTQLDPRQTLERSRVKPWVRRQTQSDVAVGPCNR